VYNSVGGGKRLRKTLISVTVISLLVCAQLVFVGLGAGKWYYWIEPGAYAEYTYIEQKPTSIPLDRFYLTNESIASHYFSNFTLVWTVTAVQDVYATVDYNLTFYDVKYYYTNMTIFGPYIDLGNLTYNTTVTVRLDTLELVENGTVWGRWPYWIHGWEVDKNVTMIYNYPRSPDWMGQLGGEPKNVTVTLGSGESVLQYDHPKSPVYNFTQERLIAASTHITLETVNNHTVGTFDTRFDALYDSVSLICVGFMPRSGEMADGIMYKLGVWDITYNDDVILIDSNVNFNPSATPEDNTPTVSAWLVAGVAAALVLPIVGVALQLKTKRKGKKP
jgi:hypothetical protein